MRGILLAAPPEDVIDAYEELVRCATAVASLATHREIEPMHVSKVRSDRQIRKVLDNIVRLHSRLEPAHYFSAASQVEGVKVHRDHIVPVRALVDRMIMNPGECAAILASVHLAEITAEEHRQLGGLWSDHPDEYAAMLTVPAEELLGVGMGRYRNCGIDLHERIF